MSIFNEFFKKEKPVFTGLKFGFGSGGGGAPKTLKTQGTGGTIITNTAADRIIHYITNPAHNFVADATISDARIVIVGGGAAGGGEHGGGGGAGKVVYTASDYTINAGTHPISLGAGANFNPSTPGSDGSWNRGGNGSTTVFTVNSTPIQAIGGGGGGTYNNNKDGLAGGSSGGGGAPNGPGGSVTASPPAPGDFTSVGYAGGTGSEANPAQLAGGGGGGAGGVGGNGSGSGGGDGGPAFSLPWFTPAVGVDGKVAGGGGGAGYQEPNSPNSPSALAGANVPAVEGGAGRGGFGPEPATDMNPFFGNGNGGGEDATAGTGSGGGGARNNTPGGGGAGGSGCVIISYGPS